MRDHLADGRYAGSFVELRGVGVLIHRPRVPIRFRELGNVARIRLARKGSGLQSLFRFGLLDYSELWRE